VNLIKLTIQEICSKTLPYLEHHKRTSYLFMAWLHMQLEEALAMQLFLFLTYETGETESAGNQRTSVGQPAS